MAESVDEEEKSANVEGLLYNLTIETAGTEEEVTEGLEAALGMEVDEDGEGEGEEGADGTHRSLGAI